MTAAALQVGVLLLDSYQLLDAAGPLDSLTMLTPSYLQAAKASASLLTKAIPMDFHYISHSLEPVAAASGPLQQPTCTYATCPPLNILLIPGPPPDVQFSPELIRFIQQRVEEVDVVMGVCTGSIVLAYAGVLNGKKASTNKSAQGFAVKAFPQVQWTVKGRWTVDGKFWTSSGVTAGMDMMAAFLMSHYDQELVKWTHALAEFVPKKQDDDPFTWILDNTDQQ
jgi:transcriptional regulator GlxA family with amidase domain